jgi:hypothetical protein
LTTQESHPSIEFSLKLLKVAEEVCVLVIDGPTVLLQQIVDIINLHIYELAGDSTRAKTVHVGYLNTKHWDSMKLNPLNQVAID